MVIRGKSSPAISLNINKSNDVIDQENKSISSMRSNKSDESEDKSKSSTSDNNCSTNNTIQVSSDDSGSENNFKEFQSDIKTASSKRPESPSGSHSNLKKRKVNVIKDSDSDD